MHLGKSVNTSIRGKIVNTVIQNRKTLPLQNGKVPACNNLSSVDGLTWRQPDITHKSRLIQSENKTQNPPLRSISQLVPNPIYLVDKIKKIFTSPVMARYYQTHTFSINRCAEQSERTHAIQPYGSQKFTVRCDKTHRLIY